MQKRSLLFTFSLLFFAFALIWLGCGKDFGLFEPAKQPEPFDQVMGVAKPTGPERFVPGEILVKFKAAAPDVAGEEIPRIGVRVVKVKAGDEHAAIARFKARSDVEYAEVNGIWEIDLVPNDTYFNTRQWNMKIIDGPGAWDKTQGSNTVKIAILDTGIKSNHEDLAGKVVAAANFSTSTTVEDKNGHGTHVAGIAAATTNNGKGIAGVGFNCSLMNGKVFNEKGSATWDKIAASIIWAADNGAKVINMSFGGPDPSLTIENAVNDAWGKGVVLVASAGNEGKDALHYPASYDNVIAVAATDQNDNLAKWSTYGTWVDVAAPGVSIFSTYIRFKPPYTSMSGTSMASPHVAGLAGLLASQNRSSTNIRAAIETTTDKAGSYPIANGRINAYKAVSAP